MCILDQDTSLSKVNQRKNTTSCNYDLTAYEIRESKIIKNENEWYVFITIGQKSEPLDHKPTNILAIDLGCKNIAVTVNTANTRHLWKQVKTDKRLSFPDQAKVRTKECVLQNKSI